MLTLTLGITFIIGGIIKQILDVYFEKSILPKTSIKEQEKYKNNEDKKSQMGAYNIPFKNRKLISKLHNVHEFNAAIVVLGFFVLLMSFIEIVTK